MYVWAWAGGPGATEVFFPLTAGERGSRGRAGWQRGCSPGQRGLQAWVRTASDPHQSLSSAGDSAPHFRDEETEAQRSTVTYLRSHNSKVIAKTCTGSATLSRQLVSRVEEGRARNPVKRHFPRSRFSLLDLPNLSGTVNCPPARKCRAEPLPEVRHIRHLAQSLAIRLQMMRCSVNDNEGQQTCAEHQLTFQALLLSPVDTGMDTVEGVWPLLSRSSRSGPQTVN